MSEPHCYRCGRVADREDELTRLDALTFICADCERKVRARLYHPDCPACAIDKALISKEKKP